MRPPSWRATSFPRLLVQYIHNYPPCFKDLLQPPLPTWGHALPSWQATGIIQLRAPLCLLNLFCCIWILLNFYNDHTSARSSFNYYVTTFRDQHSWTTYTQIVTNQFGWEILTSHIIHDLFSKYVPPNFRCHTDLRIYYLLIEFQVSNCSYMPNQSEVMSSCSTEYSPT